MKRQHTDDEWNDYYKELGSMNYNLIGLTSDSVLDDVQIALEYAEFMLDFTVEEHSTKDSVALAGIILDRQAAAFIKGTGAEDE